MLVIIIKCSGSAFLAVYLKGELLIAFLRYNQRKSFHPFLYAVQTLKRENETRFTEKVWHVLPASWRLYRIYWFNTVLRNITSSQNVAIHFCHVSSNNWVSLKKHWILANYWFEDQKSPWVVHKTQVQLKQRRKTPVKYRLLVDFSSTVTEESTDICKQCVSSNILIFFLFFFFFKFSVFLILYATFQGICISLNLCHYFL